MEYNNNNHNNTMNNHNNNNNQGYNDNNSSHSIQSLQSIHYYSSDNNSNYSTSNYTSYDDDDENNHNNNNNNIIIDITSGLSTSFLSYSSTNMNMNYNNNNTHNINLSTSPLSSTSSSTLIPPGMNQTTAQSSAVNLINTLANLSIEEINKFQPLFIYEVRFKTSIENYTFHEKLNKGEMVTVQCERGYNIGFVDNEVISNDENIPAKRILAKLLDEDHTIQDMLKYKVTAEKNALSQCRLHCKGHRLGNFADAIAAEFQFDRKKLTVYLKKFEDVSVCRLVRKLYDTYKMRIKVLEVDDPETMKEMTKKYLELSKLNISLAEAFNFDPNSSVLSSKSQGKSNKMEKQTPNYSKSHLGQSQHLIPSLVHYGPQAEKRHNNTPQQNGVPYNQHVLSHAATTTTPTNINNNFSPLNRADRHFDFPNYYGQDIYDMKYHQQNQQQQFIQSQSHGINMNTFNNNNNNITTSTTGSSSSSSSLNSRNQFSSHSNISWSSSNPNNFNPQQQQQPLQHIGNTNYNINNNNNIYGNNVNVNSNFNQPHVMNMNINNGININNNINHHNNMAQRGVQFQSTYGRDRQNDKYYSNDNYPFSTEPFGHEGSYMDESFRYQSNNKYQSNYNDSTFSDVHENFFPSQIDDQFSYRHHQEQFGLEVALPLSTDNLASLVAKHKGINPSSNTISSTPNTISPSSQSSQSTFNYADLPF